MGQKLNCDTGATEFKDDLENSKTSDGVSEMS